jgi:hypothetical protein
MQQPNFKSGNVLWTMTPNKSLCDDSKNLSWIFFKKHLMAYLDNTFVSKQAFIMEIYKQVMESKFLVELKGFLEYTKLLNLLGFLEWLDCKVSNVASNLMQWFEVFYSQKDKAYWFVETKLYSCATFVRWG